MTKIKVPTIEEINKVFPFSEKIPYGYDKPVRLECARLLGQSYYGFSRYRWEPWLNKDAKWYVKNMTLYVLDEKDLSIITVAMLAKQANK